MTAAKVFSGGRSTVLQGAAWLLSREDTERGPAWRPLLADHEVVVRATWLGLPSAAEAGLGAQVVGIVTRAGTRAVLRPGARVLMCGEITGPGPCICAEDDLLPIPDALTPSLAVVAWSLAIARRAVSELPETVGRVLIRGYRELGAAVHAELDRQRPDARVTVLEDADRAVHLAQAFGARIVGTVRGTHDVEFVVADASRAAAGTVVDLRIAPAPTAVEIAAALDLLAARPWRYLPIITDGLTVDEASSGAGGAVKAVVCL